MPSHLALVCAIAEQLNLSNDSAYREYGYKFPPENPEQQNKIKYSVYINEFILGDNTIAVEMDGEKMVFLNHNVINYIMTNNKEFINYTFETLKILLKKSMLISEISERDRQLFFHNLRERIHERERKEKKRNK